MQPNTSKDRANEKLRLTASDLIIPSMSKIVCEATKSRKRTNPYPYIGSSLGIREGGPGHGRDGRLRLQLLREANNCVTNCARASRSPSRREQCGHRSFRSVA